MPTKISTSRIALALGAMALIGTIIFSFGPLPNWILSLTHSKIDSLSLKIRLEREQSIRSLLLQAVAGTLLVFGAWGTWRQVSIARLQFDLARSARVNESFTRAIEFLGSTDSSAVRIGGIYTLDRIAEADRKEKPRVCDLLTAFIKADIGNPLDPVSSDTQAAITVLAKHCQGIRLDLSGARLRMANFEQTDLRGASLRNCSLVGASFRNADLRGADLKGSDIANVNFTQAQQDGSTRWPD